MCCIHFSKTCSSTVGPSPLFPCNRSFFSPLCSFRSPPRVAQLTLSSGYWSPAAIISSSLCSAKRCKPTLTLSLSHSLSLSLCAKGSVMSHQRWRLQSSSSSNSSGSNTSPTYRSRIPFRTGLGLPLFIAVYLCLLCLSVNVYADEIAPPSGAHIIEDFDMYYGEFMCPLFPPWTFVHHWEVQTGTVGCELHLRLLDLFQWGTFPSII